MFEFYFLVSETTLEGYITLLRLKLQINKQPKNSSNVEYRHQLTRQSLHAATPQEKEKTYIMLHKQNFLLKLWTWQKGILKLKSTVEKHAKITATRVEFTYNGLSASPFTKFQDVLNEAKEYDILHLKRTIITESNK